MVSPVQRIKSGLYCFMSDISWLVITGGVGVCVAGRLSPRATKVKLVPAFALLSTPVFGRGGSTGIEAVDLDLEDFCLAVWANPAKPAATSSNTSSAKENRKRVVVMNRILPLRRC